MSNNTRIGTTVVVGGLLILLTLAAVGLIMLAHQRRSAAADGAGNLPVISRVSEFALTNQFGKRVRLDALKGKVWVADIIFTRCAGPCPRMTQQMSELQAALAAHPEVILVTLTTDPNYDSPAIMKRYAERFGANHARWWFLTGSKAEIARLAIDGLKLTAMEVPSDQRAAPEDLFVHSTIFAVVDAQGQVRAAIETQDDDLTEEQQVADEQSKNRWAQRSKPRLLQTIVELLKAR